MVGSWFTTPWRLVSQSHGAVAWRCRCPFPSHVPFSYATSHHHPIPRVPWTPYPAGLLCGPSHTPFPVPSPFPIIPCLYPTGPAATLWRGPNGSSSNRGTFRAPSTGRSLTAPAPFPCAAAPAYSPGLLCGPIPSLIPCLYPTGPPATLWHESTGSSFIRGTFRAPSTGGAPPAPASYSYAASHAVLVAWGRRVVLVTRPFVSYPHFPASRFYFFGAACNSVARAHQIRCLPGSGSLASHWSPPSRPLLLAWCFPIRTCGGSLFLAPGPPVTLAFPPRGHPSLLVLLFLAMIFFLRHPRSLVCTFCSVPSPRFPLASCCMPSCGDAGFCWCLLFFFSPCFLPRGSFLPACTHINTAEPSVWAQIGAHVQSHRLPLARPLAVPGPARGAPLPRVPDIYAFYEVFLLSLLSTVPSPLLTARSLTVVLLLRVLAAGRPRAMLVSRALSRALGPPPCLPTCRPTWATSADTPSGGLPHRPPPPAAPPSVP